MQKIQGLTDNELKVPPELPVLSFLGALRSISEDNPVIQRLVNRNAEKLASIIDVIQKPDSPVEDMQSAPIP